jgi:hypothetical protein
MRRRFLLLLGCLAAILLAVCLPCWLMAPGHRIGEAACGEIQSGMTRAQVEAVLGVPPGDYSGGRVYPEDCKPYPMQLGMESWIVEDGVLWVCFSEQGTALWAEFIPVTRSPEGPLAKLPRWLGF